MKKLRVGIIGCGRISIMHLVPASILKQSELVCCCDIDENAVNKVAKKFHITPYSNYKEMIEKENLDVVHICLPHYLHVEVSEYAFKKGVNVLCEKPMSIDYQSAIRCVNKAKESHVSYGVIFQCRYDDATELVKKRLDDGSLGKIKFAKSILTWNRNKEYYSSSNWKGTWEKEGGGVVIDQAIHSIDMVNYLINDEFDQVKCSFKNHNHPYLKVEDTAEGYITYKNGAIYTFYCMNNYGDDEPIEIDFICEKGKVKMSYDYARITYNDGRVEEVTQHQEVINYEGAKKYWGAQHIKQITQFYNACLGLEKLQISGEEALKTHALIFKIYEEGKKTL